MDLRALFNDLVRFEIELWNEIDARLRHECGVPLGSLSVMLVIERTPDCRVNEIAAALSITVGGVSQAVDRLEQRGHVSRRPSPTDRRSSIVELTDAGRELVARAGPVFDAELERRLAGRLSDAALAELGRTLTTLRVDTP